MGFSFSSNKIVFFFPFFFSCPRNSWGIPESHHGHNERGTGKVQKASSFQLKHKMFLSFTNGIVSAFLLQLTRKCFQISQMVISRERD